MKGKSIFARIYNKDLLTFYKFVIPIGSKTAYYPDIKKGQKYDYIVLPFSVAYTEDIQLLANNIRKNCHESTRIVVIYFNFLWKPILDISAKVGLRKKFDYEPNWLNNEDIKNIFALEEFEEIITGRRFIFPIPLGLITIFINKYIAHLPLINNFCLTTYQIFRPKRPKKEYSVSIVIPARNEEGHIKGILSKIPTLGRSTEVIFVEGNSKDETYDAIKNEILRYKQKKIIASLHKQKGKGKADAVRLGFEKAKGEIFMILDADLTVPPKDLVKFYNALSSGVCDFANGSRLVYPMEKQAMRTLNYIGNKIFSFTFGYIMNQKVKDTLCGTKAFLSKDYALIKKNRKYFGDFDPFGDFDLLFGAAKLNMKITDIPIRYKERVYGTTNISRFTHGMLLLRMTILGAKKLKFV